MNTAMASDRQDERRPLIGRVDGSGAPLDPSSPRALEEGAGGPHRRAIPAGSTACARVTMCAIAAMGLIAAAYHGLNHHHPATAALLGLGDAPAGTPGLLGRERAEARIDERRATARLARVDARRAERARAVHDTARTVATRADSHAEGDSNDSCRIIFYYHVPKTGGGSIVRYFGEMRGVDVIRYESTKYITPEMGEIYTWNSATADDHWDRYVLPRALKPGNHLVVEHWGRPGMVEMERKLADLRARAAAANCEVMTSTTLRDPIDRDVSDDVFRRMRGGGDAGIDYLGDEQTRFLLLNSERARDGVAPRDLYGDHRARVEAEGALRAAMRTLRDDFDVVATIADLEAQKDAFVDFLFGAKANKGEGSDEASATEDEDDREEAAKVSSAVVSLLSQPLARVHAIDYEKEGVDDARMRALRTKFERSNDLDKQLYRLAAEMSANDPRLAKHRQAPRR